jgi:Tfp pilus assembly protein PilX
MRGSNFMIKARNRGFTLLIAIVLASVATAIGVALASLAYKNVRISAVGQASQYAFYAADTALECTLYADQQLATFDYLDPSMTRTVSCVNGSSLQSINFTASTWNASTKQFSSTWFPIDGYCARVTVYKSLIGTSTLIYSEGVSNCNTTDPRTLERGLYSFY